MLQKQHIELNSYFGHADFRCIRVSL